MWNKAVREGEELVDQHRIVRPDGEIIWVAVRARWARTGDGKRHSFVGIVEDITAIKAAHENMKRAKEAAEAASRSKGEFLANMSHEIRTPLNGIIGMTELTLETELTPDQREYLETVKFSADSLLTVINDILDFSKIEAGKLDLEAIAFNLDSCLRSAVRTLYLRAMEKNIELTYEISSEVPKAVCGDPTRLTQIVVNLLGNADTGIGIAPEKQKLIFAPFSQADTSTTRKFGGTGLGLSISMRLVEMMQGKIWLESELGQGTRFHFTVQFGQAVERKNEPALLENPALAIVSNIKVLIVEDNPVNQVLVTKLLEKRGFSPVLASNGRQALAVLQKETFDIILMDVQMPEMDGFETTVEIRKRERTSGGHQYIIALTAHAMKGDRERCLQAGMDSYLSKPIRPDELDAVLRACPKIGQTAKAIAAGKK
jgi:CheY-like chemotaxis protein